MATFNFLAVLLKNRIMSQPSIKIKELKNLCKSEYKLNASMNLCRNTKVKVMRQLLGDFKDQFIDLHDYVEEIKKQILVQLV